VTKLVKILVGIMLILCYKAHGQWQYCIDINPPKERKVELRFWINKKIATYKVERENYKNKKAVERYSRRLCKKHFRLQTRKVKRRMRKSKRISRYNNKGEYPWYVILISKY
jgi:hypothetical protein